MFHALLTSGVIKPMPRTAAWFAIHDQTTCIDTRYDHANWLDICDKAVNGCLKSAEAVALAYNAGWPLQHNEHLAMAWTMIASDMPHMSKFNMVQLKLALDCSIEQTYQHAYNAPPTSTTDGKFYVTQNGQRFLYADIRKGIARDDYAEPALGFNPLADYGMIYVAWFSQKPVVLKAERELPKLATVKRVTEPKTHWPVKPKRKPIVLRATTWRTVNLTWTGE